MNPMLKKLLARYMAPAGDDGSDTGGADTANTDVAALDDDDAYMAQSEEDRRRLRGGGGRGIFLRRGHGHRRGGRVPRRSDDGR